MHGALKLSMKLGFIDEDIVKRGLDLIKSYHLPITTKGLDPKDVYQDMFLDKKTSHHRLVFGLLDDIGKGFLSQNQINKDIIIECLEEIC